MGSTRAMLVRQWGMEIRHRPIDFSRIDKIEHAFFVISKMEEETGTRACAWMNTDTCRMCVAPEAGKCPAMSVDVAA